MLKQMIVREIRDLRQGGHSLREAREFLEGRPGKTPSMPTIRKCHGTEGVPEDPRAKTARPHAFDAGPFRSDVPETLALNPKRYAMRDAKTTDAGFSGNHAAICASSRPDSSLPKSSSTSSAGPRRPTLGRGRILLRKPPMYQTAGILASLLALNANLEYHSLFSVPKDDSAANADTGISG